jgi:hypothetical protein
MPELKIFGRGFDSRRLHISRGRGLGVIAPALQAGGRGFDTIFGARCSKVE